MSVAMGGAAEPLSFGTNRWCLREKEIRREQNRPFSDCVRYDFGNEPIIKVGELIGSLRLSKNRATRFALSRLHVIGNLRQN